MSGSDAGVGTDLVDLPALGRWMDDQGLPGGDITDTEVLAGGTQNLLLRFRRGGRPFILRRGPRHLRRASNDVMRREARVLQALAGSDVPHPGFVAGPGEPDEGVAGDAVFYLMEPVDGFN
ncbi:MAG TPA: phosphotransferase, partial [Acidimicrobiales bacterium]